VGPMSSSGPRGHESSEKVSSSCPGAGITQCHRRLCPHPRPIGEDPLPGPLRNLEQADKGGGKADLGPGIFFLLPVTDTGRYSQLALHSNEASEVQGSASRIFSDSMRSEW